MCRWFVYISATEDCFLQDVLVDPEHCLSKMVDDHYLPGLVHSDPRDVDKSKDKEAMLRNGALNIDGLGLAWYTGTRADFVRDCHGLRPALYKSVSPLLNDYNFNNLCANTSTRLLFAHIRASSGSAVTPVNCHPFVFGRHSLMHNGTVTGFVNIRRQLCPLLDDDSYANVAGSSDTEHLAALYMSILTSRRGKAAWEEQYSCKDMLAAMRDTIGIVVRLQREALGENARPSNLNLAVTDGERCICLRFRNHHMQQPPSLYWSDTAGQTLNRKYPDRGTTSVGKHGKHLIVASEPTTYDPNEWHLIQKNHCVSVDSDGATVHSSFDYDDSWNFDDEVDAQLRRAGRRESGCKTN